MSAFILNPDHIGQLAIYCHKVSKTRRHLTKSFPATFEHLGENSEQFFAHHLAYANWQSIEYRYDDKAAVEMSGFRSCEDYAIACSNAARNDHALSPIQLIKMFRCFAYQSCEGGLSKYLTEVFCERIISVLVTEISGYEEAAWEYEPHVVAFDTLCDGWQAWKDETDQPEIFCNQWAAEAAINEAFEELTRNQIESGMEPDEEPEEFAIPLAEYIEGRKTIFLGGQPAGYISGTQPELKQ